MEYFVDEMPRDCASCKHYHMNCADGYSCSKLRKEIHPNFSEGICYRYQDCPLQSLADHDKQVRKEVCDDLCNEIEFIWGIHQEITITHIRDILRSYAERIEKGK